MKDRQCIVCGDDYKIKVCNVEGEYKGESMCHMHEQQIRRNGKITNPNRSRRRDPRICDVCGDDYDVRQMNLNNEYSGQLLCLKHYNQIRNNGCVLDKERSHLRDERICNICGETEGKIIFHTERKEMMCLKHYSQIKNLGKIYERTVFDKNEIFIKDDYAEVVLYNIEHQEAGRAIIDLEDVDKIKDYKWSLGTHDYAITRIYQKDGSSKSIAMHKLLTNTTTKEIVDHINRNGLDNRRANLRVTNKSVNAINAGLRSNNKSGVTGVSYSKIHNLWRSYINAEGKRLELGWFDNIDDAIKSRLNAEVTYYSDYPPQRHLFDKYNISFKARGNKNE